MGLSEQVRLAILVGLRDIAYHDDILREFSGELVFQTSLLRNIDSHRITRLFRSILQGHARPTPYAFQFLLNGDESTKIEVDVKPNSNPPTNVHVLIGRNGVGKTRILSGLADELAKSSNPSEVSQSGTIEFISVDRGSVDKDVGSKGFANLITVAFSAFDHFKPIRNNKLNSIPCQYIGLKDETGEHVKSPSDLTNDFRSSVEVCFSSQRKSRWIEAIRILNSDPIFREYALDETIAQDNAVASITGVFDKLSSGHKIVLLTVTKLVELVDERTLILIDELENHLHPPLLSSFVRAISDLVIKRNGVAIIATHSPVVLQEVPRSCITTISRVNTTYSLYRPNIETYGENVGTLTREIFGLEVLDSGFYKTINDYLGSNMDFEELIEAFDGQIGSEGKAIARSIVFTSES